MIPSFRPHSSANVERAEFARRLVQHLRDRDMNQSDLARKTGLSRDAISTYVRARSMPEPRNLKVIAEALGLAPSDLTLAVENDPTSGEARRAAHHGVSEEFTPRPRVSMSVLDNGKARVEIVGTLPMDLAMKVMKVYADAVADADRGG